MGLMITSDVTELQCLKNREFGDKRDLHPLVRQSVTPGKTTSSDSCIACLACPDSDCLFKV